MDLLFQRRGTVLTWFAIFLFALMPLMTLIVHLGMVTLTRRQMQTAVNSAAVEGLRGRDELSETQRRQRVHDLVSAVFDDNLNSDGGDVLRLGAGPIIRFEAEPSDISLPGTDFKASRTIKSENISVYDPDLQLNTADGQHGDMLSGQYVRDGRNEENDDYYRGDFLLPGDDASHPYSMYFPLDHDEYDTDIGEDAFLVRLRRTDNPDSLDKVPGVSSSEYTIPFLFGRGPYGGTDFLDSRERGTLVRATAIAQARPIVTVGVPEPVDDLNEGLALFEIDLASWTTLTTDSPELVTLNPDGSITGGMTSLNSRFIVRSVTTLGDQTTALDTIPGDLETGETRVVAITTTIGMEDHIVVGFGLAEMNGSPMSYTITRLPGTIVFRNAVASFVKQVSGPVPDFTDVWSEFQNVSDRALAPALVRTME
ncbi:TadE/TadG family type IV pilus assembly protein [Gimesia maris]|uniref:TadE/TadG family type IV pilus assembly protein n=1 Tax=Gimesia maris TaxID=122 RepID=UPI0012B758D5|nr:Tad domain-containing protein [Gimesia maris]